MRRLTYGLIFLLAGCCTLNEDYIRQDRANYETLAPRVRKMLKTTKEFDDVQKLDIEDRLEAWDTKSAAAMATLKKED